MSSEPTADIPKPVIKKMRWPFPIIWIVPVAAACLAGYFLYQHHQETGTEITIQFDDGAGLRPGETTVAMRGVTVGHVKTIDLSADHLHAIAHIQLETSESSLARANTLFWVVRPELSLQNISGLSTIVSGPYIDCRPGDGPSTSKFNGLAGPPMITGPGLMIIVSAEQIGPLTVDSPVNYRGIQVGVVKDIRLSKNADAANVTLFIWEHYKSLVRTNTKFWMIKGADLRGSLFSGLSLKLGSVQNILNSGVAFATPETDYGNFVTEGESFELNEQSKDEWLKWKPKIQLSSDDAKAGAQKTSLDESKKQLPNVKRE